MTDFEIFNEGNAIVKAWTRGLPVEGLAKDQLLQTAQMPFIYKWLAAMPDVHAGLGATVGSVIATKGAIIPSAVGVDIGCGMVAERTSLTSKSLPDNLKGIYNAISKAVPHGRTDNGGSNDRGAWGTVPENVRGDWGLLAEGFSRIVDKHPKIGKSNNMNHLGTLGTGNHFIEVCLDEEDRVWVMLHSGSRGVGGRIGSYFIEAAKREMERWFIQLPNRDLAYIVEGSKMFDDYIEAVGWAQEFALLNRSVMMSSTLRAIASELQIGIMDLQVRRDRQAVNCHHNYVAREHHYGKNVFVTRKGAVRARTGDLGIIPGSMGAKSFIVRGKGNPESFHSCSHGAGRKMSRTEAKRRFTVEDHAIATAGIECRKDVDVIDETPGAYKDIDAVMAAQSSLVDVVHTLRQVCCIKG